MDPDALTETRSALHQVAEHVLAAARYAATGRIGLSVVDGGFGIAAGAGPPVAVIGTDLVVDGRHHQLTTVADAARACGIEPGGPAVVYPLSTPLQPDRLLVVEATAANEIHRWFALVQDALERFSRRHEAEKPGAITLWPEHFDLALSMGECNFGGSPGDAGRPEPYAYVGPWSPDAHGDDDFWNEPYGSARSRHDVSDTSAIESFFGAGWGRLARRG